MQYDDTDVSRDELYAVTDGVYGVDNITPVELEESDLGPTGRDAPEHAEHDEADDVAASVSRTED